MAQEEDTGGKKRRLVRNSDLATIDADEEFEGDEYDGRRR
jgi:hypothetical protein